MSIPPRSVELNDKHIEELSHVRCFVVFRLPAGDSSYLLGQYVDRYVFAKTVQNIALAGGTPPEAEASNPWYF